MSCPSPVAVLVKFLFHSCLQLGKAEPTLHVSVCLSSLCHDLPRIWPPNLVALLSRSPLPPAIWTIHCSLTPYAFSPPSLCSSLIKSSPWFLNIPCFYSSSRPVPFPLLPESLPYLRNDHSLLEITIPFPCGISFPILYWWYLYPFYREFFIVDRP